MKKYCRKTFQNKFTIIIKCVLSRLPRIDRSRINQSHYFVFKNIFNELLRVCANRVSSVCAPTVRQPCANRASTVCQPCVRQPCANRASTVCQPCVNRVPTNVCQRCVVCQPCVNSVPSVCQACINRVWTLQRYITKLPNFANNLGSGILI